MNWILDPIKLHYFDFSGRATRQEYWMFVLFNVIIGLLLGMSILISDLFAIVLGVYFVIVFIPSLAITFRRLHDTGRSGWWLLLSFIPYIGNIVLIVFYCLPSEKGTNKYGPNTYGVEAAQASVSPMESMTPPTTPTTA